MVAITEALKEWAIIVKALEAGDTILLLRKGGIREEKGQFKVPLEKALLYPTYEHQQPHLLKPEYTSYVTPVKSGWHPQTISLRSWVNITHVFVSSEESVIKDLYPHHIGSQDFAEKRLHWKPHQPLYLLLLRVYKLPQPKIISYCQEYAGCRSWIQLKNEISLDDSFPVLEQKQYNNQVDRIKCLIKN